MTADGLVNQINNPEVEVDISRPDLLTRRRVLALRSVASRLVGACHGQDLDFQDAGEVAASSSPSLHHPANLQPRIFLYYSFYLLPASQKNSQQLVGIKTQHSEHYHRHRAERKSRINQRPSLSKVAPKQRAPHPKAL